MLSSAFDQSVAEFSEVQPPSTRSVWPVMKLAAELDRKITADATSLACPSRWAGLR